MSVEGVALVPWAYAPNEVSFSQTISDEEAVAPFVRLPVIANEALFAFTKSTRRIGQIVSSYVLSRVHRANKECHSQYLLFL